MDSKDFRDDAFQQPLDESGSGRDEPVHRGFIGRSLVEQAIGSSGRKTGSGPPEGREHHAPRAKGSGGSA
jgi:hypothetical protein